MNTTTTSAHPTPGHPPTVAFEVHVPERDLDDLRNRLAHTRLPMDTPDADWDRGTPNTYLREMVTLWETFDWRAVEARLNTYPQFQTTIDSQTIHYFHVRSLRADATALLLGHTYPGSVLDFIELIDRLTNDFHLVIPSMPGTGFSTPLSSSGWTMARTARAYDTLMRNLDYKRYGAHGSDGVP